MHSSLNPAEVAAVRIHHCSSNIIIVNVIYLVPQDICPAGQPSGPMDMLETAFWCHSFSDVVLQNQDPCHSKLCFWEDAKGIVSLN